MAVPYLCIMIRELTDLLMPRACVVCGRQLGAQEEQLCIWCAADLPLTYTWERTHNVMAQRFNQTLESTRPEGESMDYAYAASLLFYHLENPYKSIPQALKYHGNIQAGRYFAAMLGCYLARAPNFASVDTVVPVPLHWRRKWKRGYNQAQVIAEELARALKAKLRTDLLIRRRNTRSQTSLDAQERLKNMADVFQLRHRVPAKHILVVDDTFTTGATLAACHNAIRSALGPSVRISVATLAMVED